MQIQEGADIVNLTQEFETKEGVKKEKADNYWDPPENSNPGEIGHKNTEGHKLVADLGEGKKVFQTTIEVKPWGKEYTFEVREDGGAPQSIKLFHHEKWPDFGVVDLSDLKTFISDVHQGRDPTKTNLTVHCSAGCGRTGTFIGVDVASQPMNNQNAASLTNKMREFRSGMVQTKEQYDLIKQAFFIRNLPLIAHKNDEEPTKESIDKAGSITLQNTTEESRKITVQQLKEEGIAKAAQLYKTNTISEHFDVKNIAADGDCFFASIANQLPSDSSLDMLGVRKAIADHMVDKLEDYKEAAIDLEYIENLKLSSKGKDSSGWGSDIEAKAFSEIYNCPVIIYRHNGKRQEFIPAGASYKSPIFLLFNGTNHYDALTLKP